MYEDVTDTNNSTQLGNNKNVTFFLLYVFFPFSLDVFYVYLFIIRFILTSLNLSFTNYYIEPA